MAFHIRAYTLMAAPFLVSISAACAVLLARVFVRRRSRNAVLLVLEARAYEMIDVFVKAASGSTDEMPEREEEGACVEVKLNWKNAKLLRVPALLFDGGHLDIMDLFEVYSGLLRNKSSDKLLICDSWNCLVAIVRHHLRRHVKEDNALLLDEIQAEGLLAVCILLRRRYDITKSSLLLNSSPLVESFPEGLFQLFLSAYRKKKSIRLGLLSFLKLVWGSCSTRQLIGLICVLLLSPDVILMTLVGWHTDMHWMPLCVTEIEKALTPESVSCEHSFFQFMKENFFGATGALVAIAVNSIGPIELIYCLRNFVTGYILMDLVTAFHVSAYLALATADYNPDDNWSLSQSVLNALWQVSSLVMGELQSQLPYLTQLFCSAWVVMRFPAMALTIWLGAQWNDLVEFLNESLYLESQYAKRHLLSLDCFLHQEEGESRNEKKNCEEGRMLLGGQLNFPSPISLIMKAGDFFVGNNNAAGGKQKSFFQLQTVAPAGMRQHHGLAVLLLVFLELKLISKPSWNCILQNASWPMAPTALVRHIFYTLEKALVFETKTTNSQRIQGVKAVMQIMLCMREGIFEAHSGSRYVAEYHQGFMFFRQNGMELGVVKAFVEAPYGSRNDKREYFIRDFLRGVFRTTSAMPLLLTSIATLCSSKAYLEQDALEQSGVISHLEFIQHAFPLFPTFADLFYEEHGLSAAQVDLARVQRQLTLGGSSLGCYQVLEELQFMQHKIDRPIMDPPPLMEGPWSIEFHDVSYRYSEDKPYILWHVSFRVEKGSFLGITGYSGAGKTTILRLLNGTYAPTLGEIRINGIDIRRYPARMLRRRIANVWQEESQLRLFDHLSIADNVAFGNLWSCSVTDIYGALSAARALNFVQNRSSNIFAPLRAQEFSGGEVERLCIARALMRKSSEACVYVFDEATSAVDTETERSVFCFLGLTREAKRTRQTTCVIVSHRLATLKSADTVLVLNDGRVEQLGCWDDLCKGEADSSFLRMMRSQQLPLFDS
ncbi:putative ABC transporter [Trypanosoma cruzi]|uniref:Putative ABC transporter n=1 Tax=Trypanosoma cruzi TaxID=5693 RepID=A0A2V2VSF0_TRYCR|nr:putative ABC transporter [Trypanosoma cruzi]